MTLVRRTLTSAALALGVAVMPAHAAPTVDAPAPAFSATDIAGNTVSLDQLKGKTVVLEWTNHDCPFVRKHYDSGNMQSLQQQATADGVVWISVVSSAPGLQGHVSPEEAAAIVKEEKATVTHKILDPSGEIGRLYDARTTPHMYVIDGAGMLRYMGGIDNKPTANPADVEGATNYVTAALTQLAAGQDVQTKTARPYGCSVKYK